MKRCKTASRCRSWDRRTDAIWSAAARRAAKEALAKADMKAYGQLYDDLITKEGE